MSIYSVTGKRTHEPSSNFVPSEPTGSESAEAISQPSKSDNPAPEHSLANRVTDRSCLRCGTGAEIETAKKQKLFMDSDPQKQPQLFLDAVEDNDIYLVPKMLRNVTFPPDTIHQAYLRAAEKSFRTIMLHMLSPSTMEKQLPIQWDSLRESMLIAVRKGYILMTERLCNEVLLDDTIKLLNPNQPISDDERQTHRTNFIQLIIVALQEANRAYFATNNPNCKKVFDYLCSRLLFLSEFNDKASLLNHLKEMDKIGDAEFPPL